MAINEMILAAVLIGAVFLIVVFLLSTAIVDILEGVKKYAEKKEHDNKPWSIRSDFHPYWSGTNILSWSTSWEWNRKHYKQIQREARRDQSRLQSVKLGGVK